MKTAIDTTYNCFTSSLLAHYRVQSQRQQVGTLRRNKAGLFFAFPQRRTLFYLINVNANKQAQIFWRSKLWNLQQWNLQQPSNWVKRINGEKPFSDWSCLQLPLPHCVSASPMDQQLHWGSGRWHQQRDTHLSFSPSFLTSFSLFSHCLHCVHVCTGQMDDLQIESNQKMLLIYSSSSLFQTQFLKNKSLFFQYDHRLLSQLGNYYRKKKKKPTKLPNSYGFVRSTVLWPISQNILISVFNPLYNILFCSHENPCIPAKDFLDKSISGRMPQSKSP